MLGKKSPLILGLITLFSISLANATTITVPMYLTTQNKSIGTVTITDAYHGIILTPHLSDLTPGTHGFHIHETPSCANQGMAAGGHLDPTHTNTHQGPYNNTGHLGDLAVLVVNPDGTATLPTFAPRLTVALLKNHALMIHAGGDNYADAPEKLGGGGARVACGVIKAS